MVKCMNYEVVCKTIRRKKVDMSKFSITDFVDSIMSELISEVTVNAEFYPTPLTPKYVEQLLNEHIDIVLINSNR